MTASPYFHGGSEIPLVDGPENFGPQIWIINFEKYFSTYFIEIEQCFHHACDSQINSSNNRNKWLSLVTYTNINLHNAFPDKQRLIINRKERQRMTKSKSAVEWLKYYATSFGEKLPNTCQIHLPPCSTKLHVYERMVSESQVDFPEPISYSHFLRLWREEASYIAIPKVYSIA